MSWFEEYGDEENERTGPIAKDALFASMRGSDLELEGAAYEFVSNPKYARRVSPPVTLDEFVAFSKHYFERCLHANRHGRYSDSRYEAGHEIVRVFVSLWKDESVPRKKLEELRDWLERLYLEGDEELRLALVTATLKHLFESRKIKKFFESWRKRPILEKAYREAAEWGQFHPNLDRSIFGTDV